MSFISLPKGKLHEKTKIIKWKIFPVGYVGRFYRNLAQNINSAVGSEFYGCTTGDTTIPPEDVQKYLLTTSDFGKEIQDDINLYITRDRLNNASFR